MIRVARVRLDRRDDDPRCHETSDVVDVPIRVIADDAVAEPQDLSCAEVPFKESLDPGAIENRWPRL